MREEALAIHSTAHVFTYKHGEILEMRQQLLYKLELKGEVDCTGMQFLMLRPEQRVGI